MAGKPLSIAIAADTTDFVKAVNRGVIDPLDEAAAALDAVAKDGDQAGAKLEASMVDAQKETDDLKDKQTELRKALDKTGNQGRATGRDIKDGFNDASRGAEEFKDEAQQSAREAAASFDGSATSIVDYFQEVAANAFSGFGPAGVVAGLAVAGGIGLAVSAFEGGQESAAKMKERISELTDELIAAGENGEPSIQFLVDKLKELATTTEEGSANLLDLQKKARGAASGFDKIAQAYAGNADGIQEVITLEEERLQQLEKQKQAELEANGQSARLYDQRITDQKSIIQGLKDAKTAAEEAQKGEEAYAASGAPQLEQKAALIAQVNQSYDDAAASVQDYINKETGLFDVEAYLAAMDKKEQALRDYQTNLAKAALSPEAKEFLNSQGAEAAASFVQGYLNSTPEQQRRLNQKWTEAGRTNSGQYVQTVQQGIDDGLGKKPAIIPLKADTAQADRALDRFIETNKNRTVTVTVIGKDRNGKVII